MRNGVSNGLIRHRRIGASEVDVKSPWTNRGRLVRSLGLDRNSLRRTSDKLEAYLRLAMIIAFVPLAVLISCYAAHVIRETGLREQHTEKPRQVIATVLARAPMHYSALLGSPWEWVPARWFAGATAHYGAVLAAAGTPRGATVRIWIDRSGHVSRAPMTADQLKWRVITSIVFAPATLALVILLMLSVVHGLLNRRRLAEWDSAWAELCAHHGRPK
jgi:hypothetical protein